MAPFRALRQPCGHSEYSGYGGHKPLPFDRLGNLCVIARAKRLLALVATERKRSPHWRERERRHHVFSHDAHDSNPSGSGSPISARITSGRWSCRSLNQGSRLSSKRSPPGQRWEGRSSRRSAFPRGSRPLDKCLGDVAEHGSTRMGRRSKSSSRRSTARPPVAERLPCRREPRESAGRSSPATPSYLC